ncbi:MULTISPECIES: TlpA family protein disulfide reductase [Streptomyces]|uniref:TlpA family protein disulfide reductase n=1 Tax=Streptomyces tsukubensis (strain DSM 42081 / NBRC 108919 / NRRL 18488 / 9993) TaxID=1114943 RepID=I2N3Z9_STRT9|nr:MULTISPECIES: TlpA disulfide reductase family protein [Streptomyces]AZK95807.1 redoxin domain-containing protein [Streptomyces tsukubensis]EIF91746.1 Redoxin domain-containing protein [Streptomyces tsukubensis NRRL18488]MYS65614.1 redoxin domain-containing protein [Streptomyces sp. SID5473]QKM68167.1 TlpA family protein disulfide reductase [Streptomyces tsukubensis NRRL18488]TAI44568.1 TlpA family protein disulfide reductase [Streptomyces tsukubensis]
MSHRRAYRAALTAALVAAGALTLSACTGGGTSGGGGQTNFVTNTGGISTVAKADRKPIGEIAGETLEGKPLDVADLKGKIVVLNVWGSWCPPCRAEAPALAKAATDTKADGVEFVGINTRDLNKSPALAFEEDYKVPYPSLYDPKGKLIATGFPTGTLMPNAIPSTVVLDRDGKVAARVLKAISEKEIRSMIDPLIAEK